MTSQASNTDIKQYCLTIIEKTDPPEDMPEGSWFHYVVKYGSSEINCVRSGTLSEVTLHAQNFVENLNSRSTSSYTNYANRNTKERSA